MRPIRLVLFDVTGTLLRPSRSAGTQYADAAIKHLGFPLEKYELTEQCMQMSFIKYYKSQLATYPCFGALHHISVSDWWYSVFSNCVHECVEALSDCPKSKQAYGERDLLNAFEDVYHNFQWDLLPRVEENLSKLKAIRCGSTGFVKLAAISNSDHRTSSILSEKGVLKYFDTVVTSVEAKCEKPDPRIFDFTLNKLSLGAIDRKQILHIGNLFEKDYLPAIKAGMQAMLVSDEESGEKPLLEDSHRAQNLCEVVSYVKNANQ